MLKLLQHLFFLDVSGSGYYVYIKANDKQLGQKARIISPVVNSTLVTHPSKFKF